MAVSMSHTEQLRVVFQNLPDGGVVYLQRFADQTLGILDPGIDVVRDNIDELSADIGEKHLETKPLFYFGSPSGS
jgi:hypothetical protein